MFFVSKDHKIKLLSKNLQQNLETTYISQRNNFLKQLSDLYRWAFQTLPAPQCAALTNKILAMAQEPYELIIQTNDSTQTQNVKMHTLFRYLDRAAILNPKSYFAWESVFGWLDDFGAGKKNPLQILSNYQGKFDYYRTLNGLASEINAITLHDPINTSAIKQKLQELKEFEKQIPSIMHNESAIQDGAGDISLKLTYFTGGNIFSDLFLSILGITGGIAAIIAGTVFAIPALICGSSYFGSPQFIIDSAAWLINSVLTLISSIIFPIAMLYSKYTTDSYNVFKGKTKRLIDSLEAATEDLASEHALCS